MNGRLLIPTIGLPSPSPGLADGEDNRALAMVQVIDQTGKSLPGHVLELLRVMFRGYYKVVVKSEFASGLSGSRVFLVRPLVKSDEAELLSVVKIDFYERIEQEWQAYQACIRYKLPGVAEIRSQPVYVHHGRIGGLWYSLMGEGIFDVVSLYRYWQQAGIGDIQHVLTNRLFRSLGCLWRQNHILTEFSLSEYYDSFLPVNLVIDQTALTADALPISLRPEVVHQRSWQVGDVVQLSGFQVVEIGRETRSLLLNVPDDLAGSYRLHLLNVPDVEGYRIGQVLEELFSGIIQQTRHDILLAQAQKALGETVDLAAETLILPHHDPLPNPLTNLPTLLKQSFDSRIAFVHGDLNLENILVDPESRTVALIDFARARRDHLFRDFLHLEMSLVTQVITESLTRANLSPETIIPFYEQLYWSLAQTGQASPPPGLEKSFAILQSLRQTAAHYLMTPGQWAEYDSGLILYLLGSLKFSNLDSHPTAPWPKKVAFLAAATVQRLQKEKVPGPAVAQLSLHITGTTPPIPLARDEPTPSIEPGQHYLLVQIVQAQVACLGPPWVQTQRLAVTSHTSLNYPALVPDPIEATHGEHAVTPGQIVQLGLTPILIDLVPAMMAHIAIAIIFHDSDTHQPILAFSGNFHILAGLPAGYYTILGTNDTRYPLPNSAQLETLRFNQGELFLDNRRVKDLSYVVLEVSCLDARTRFLGKDTPWDVKLRQAEAIADDAAYSIITGKKRLEEAWEVCRQRLSEGHALLQADPRYLPREADDIYKTVAIACRDKFLGRDQARSLTRYRGEPVTVPEMLTDLTHLGLDPYEDLAATLIRYARQVAQTRRRFQKRAG